MLVIKPLLSIAVAPKSLIQGERRPLKTIDETRDSVKRI